MMAIPRISGCCAIMLLGFGSTAAMARDADAASAAAVRQSCTADYHSYCTGDEPSLPIETACLRQHFLSLSTECQSALGALEKESGAASSEEESQ